MPFSHYRSHSMDSCSSQASSSSSSPSPLSMLPLPCDQFALAQVAGHTCLVQAPLSDISPLTPVDVKFYRHELSTVFQYTHHGTLHPSDFQIVEVIDDQLTHYEEDAGTVFLAPKVVDRLRSMEESQERLARLAMYGGRDSFHKPQHRRGMSRNLAAHRRCHV